MKATLKMESNLAMVLTNGQAETIMLGTLKMVSVTEAALISIENLLMFGSMRATLKMETNKVRASFFGEMDRIMTANFRMIKCTDLELNMGPMEKRNTVDSGFKIKEEMVEMATITVKSDLQFKIGKQFLK